MNIKRVNKDHRTPDARLRRKQKDQTNQTPPTRPLRFTPSSDSEITRFANEQTPVYLTNNFSPIGSETTVLLTAHNSSLSTQTCEITRQLFNDNFHIQKKTSGDSNHDQESDSSLNDNIDILGSTKSNSNNQETKKYPRKKKCICGRKECKTLSEHYFNIKDDHRNGFFILGTQQSTFIKGNMTEKELAFNELQSLFYSAVTKKDVNMNTRDKNRRLYIAFHHFPAVFLLKNSKGPRKICTKEFLNKIHQFYCNVSFCKKVVYGLYKGNYHCAPIVSIEEALEICKKEANLGILRKTQKGVNRGLFDKKVQWTTKALHGRIEYLENENSLLKEKMKIRYLEDEQKKLEEAAKELIYFGKLFHRGSLSSNEWHSNNKNAAHFLFGFGDDWGCVKAIIKAAFPEVDTENINILEKVTPFEQVLISLMRMRQGLSYEYLALFMGRNISRVSLWCSDWIPKLGRIGKYLHILDMDLEHDYISKEKAITHGVPHVTTEDKEIVSTFFKACVTKNFKDAKLENVAILLDGKDFCSDTVRKDSAINRSMFSNKINNSGGRCITWTTQMGLIIESTGLYLARVPEKRLVEHWGQQISSNSIQEYPTTRATERREGMAAAADARTGRRR